MDNQDAFRDKIANQLSKWKTTIEGLKTKMETAEESAKAKLHEQLDGLQEKRIKAEKILDGLSATSQDAWESIKAGLEQGWNDLTRTAKDTMVKVRQAMSHPNREEEIRQIAYKLWLDEHCPDGRHVEHWLKAESIWRAQQESKEVDEPRRANAKRTRARTAAAPKSTSRKTKPTTLGIRRGPKEPQ